MKLEANTWIWCLEMRNKPIYFVSLPFESCGKYGWLSTKAVLEKVGKL